MSHRTDMPALREEIRVIIERHQVLESLAERQQTDKRDLLYRSLALSAVMAAAIFLNLVVAALAGVAVPGFLLFLGLATAFLF